MSVLKEYQEIELSFVKIKTGLMVALSEKSEFEKMVIKEAAKVGSFQSAFNNVNGLFLSLFGFYKYNTFEEFIKS